MAKQFLSLPPELQAHVDRQVAEDGYESGSDYIAALIRQEQAREALRVAILEGAASPLEGPADAAYLARLRDRIEHC